MLLPLFEKIIFWNIIIGENYTIRDALPIDYPKNSVKKAIEYRDLSKLLLSIIYVIQTKEDI